MYASYTVMLSQQICGINIIAVRLSTENLVPLTHGLPADLWFDQ
jgi:hypothetical protein